jgi:hypothetical protein
MTGSAQSSSKRFAVEVRKGNVKQLPTLSMNNNVKLPMKTNAAQSMRKFVRLLKNNSA